MSDDPRWGEDPRDRDDRTLGRSGPDRRERERVEPPDVFLDRVNLPRGPEREHIRFRDRDYTLRGSESRTLAAVGAFRVVPSEDLGGAKGRTGIASRRTANSSFTRPWEYEKTKRTKPSI